MKPVINKTVTPHVHNCTKKEAITWVFLLIYLREYSLCKIYNYSLKSAHMSVIILREEDDEKQLYLVLKVSCQRTWLKDCRSVGTKL